MLEGREQEFYYLVKELCFFYSHPVTVEEIAEESNEFGQDEIVKFAQQLVTKGWIKQSGDGYVLTD